MPIHQNMMTLCSIYNILYEKIIYITYDTGIIKIFINSTLRVHF